MKKKDRQPTKHSAVARDLRTPKYRMKVLGDKRSPLQTGKDLHMEILEGVKTLDMEQE